MMTQEEKKISLIKFDKIINELRDYLKGQDNVLKSFTVDPVNIKEGFAWIKDSQNMIGELIAHYEIIINKENKVSTEIHFEDPKIPKNYFSNATKVLPEQIEPFKWLKGEECFRFKNPVDINDPTILEKISSQLLYMDENLGDTVRQILQDLHSASNHKTVKMPQPLNQILFGPPGTGKTYNTINKALEIIGENIEGKAREEIREVFDAKIKEGQIVFTTFHQSMSYEDFIEGIKPLKPDTVSDLHYGIVDGIFKNLCKEAARTNQFSVTIEGVIKPLTKDLFKEFYYTFSEELPLHSELKSAIELRTKEKAPFELFKNTVGSIVVKAGLQRTHSIVSLNELSQVLFENKIPMYKSYEQILIDEILLGKDFKKSTVDNTQKKFVLIIDEINRGNISQIFGELITLIEEDKRMGKDEALEAILPYSKLKFGVPQNLFIIGTMNTADRSVEALDAALRRRFSFEEMPPKPELIATEGKIKKDKGVLGTIDLPLLLNTINKRIEKLLDKDHQIGHSYFMAVTSLEELKAAFQKKIIPLLQEYFFGDYSKIGLVLGQGFVTLKTWNKDDSFAKFPSESSGDFDEREVYELIDYTNPATKYNIAYAGDKIAPTVPMDFEKAIKLLMNQGID